MHAEAGQPVSRSKSEDSSDRREIRDLAAELSEQQLVEAREVFNLFDKDGTPRSAANRPAYAIA